MRNMAEPVETELLPHDLITEILSWLPVEPLMRFKTVCELWRDTIQQRSFTHLHMYRRSLIYRPDVMCEDYDSLDTGSFTSIFTSLHGLMLERCISTNKYRIRNPLTKNILHFPSPDHIKSSYIFYLTFIAKTEEYKILYYHLDKTSNRSGFEILTVGIDSTWRLFDVPANWQDANYSEVRDVRIGDFVYVFGSPKAGDHPGLICLDVATEQCKEITIPSFLCLDWEHVSVAQRNKKFCFINVVQEQLHVWILEDYNKCKWNDQKTVVSLPSVMWTDYPRFWENGPFRLEKNSLAFRDNRKNLLLYKFTSGKVEFLLSASTRGKHSMLYKPSIVHLRGMKPE